jgi:hypothetical protein
MYGTECKLYKSTYLLMGIILVTKQQGTEQKVMIRIERTKGTVPNELCLAAVCLRCQLDESVQGHVDVRQIL